MTTYGKSSFRRSLSSGDLIDETVDLTPTGTRNQIIAITGHGIHDTLFLCSMHIRRNQNSRLWQARRPYG